MALDQAANFIRGSTDAAIDSTQTTISVVDASIFPDPANGEYNVVIWDVNQYPRPDQDPDVEILRVTAVDTGANDLTVTRAQEGTTGVSHPSGSAIHLTPTAKMFSDIQTKTKGLSDDGNTLNIGEVDYNNLTPDYRLARMGGTVESTDQTTTSSSYTNILEPVHSHTDVSDIPTGQTLYGRWRAMIATSDASETVSCRPTVFDFSSSSTVVLDEIAITHTGDTSETLVDSGWVSLDGVSLNEDIVFNTIGAKITGGATATVRHNESTLDFVGVSSE